MRIDSPLMTNAVATGSFTGSFTGEFIGNIQADSVAYENITGKPTLVSGSDQIDITQTTGYTSFSSSIAGDIAGLDGEYATDAELNASSSALILAYTNADSNLSSSLAADIATNASDIDTLEGKTLFSGSIQVDHDATTNFVANEHVDHSGVSITAGSGLTGGGDITITRTINVGEGTGITVGANDISTNDSEIVHDNLSGFVANEHIDHSSVTLTAGDGLSGGGDITTNRTFAVDSTVLRTTGDGVVSGSAQVSFSGLNGLPSGIISSSVQVDHDATTNFVSNEHIDHTTVSITAGSGLTGGGTIAANRTINVGAGTGVTVNADDIAIGQDVATTADVTFGSVSVTNDVTISGDLTVLGDATQLQVSALNIEDINITVASGSTTSAQADGAGITIAGANESLTWDHGNSRFNFSDDLNVAGNITVSGTVDGVDILALSTTVGGIDTSVPAIVDNSGTPAFNTGITKAEVLSILNVEDGADVTDTTNVTAAGALMDSEVDADIKTLSLPANTTISSFGASLVDDADAAAARTTLGVDAAGTDNSTDVTLNTTSHDYLSISGQEITLGTIDISDDTNLTAGTGIDLVGDEISVDVSDFLTNGANNRVITATDTDGLNGEANLTFNGNVLDIVGTTSDTRRIDIGHAAISASPIVDGNTSLSITTNGFVIAKATKRASLTYWDWTFSQRVGIGSNSVPSVALDVTGDIRATGDVIAYYSSDERLKDNVAEIDGALEKVEALRGVSFDWNDKQDIYEGHDIGVIAQEVEAVLPELVQTRDNGYKAVKYEKLTAVLIQAVKELSARVKELENK